MAESHDRRLTTNDGRVLGLQELLQTRTYEGLLEGLPTTRSNKAYLERLVQRCAANRPGVPVYLIPPIESPVELEPGEVYPFGTPATLPQTTCVARFRSLASDPMKYSELTIAWLQDAFALPIAAEAEAAIRNLDWQKHAVEFEY